MTHGADTWWREAFRLMITYRSLHLMNSTYAPTDFSPEPIHFMNTCGKDKIRFASGQAVVTMEHCSREAQELKLPDGVLEKFLSDDTQRLLFDGIQRDTHSESLQTGMEGY